MTTAQRRKRREETERGFKKAAPIIQRLAPIYHAADFVADALYWLHFWNWNHAPPDEQLDAFHYVEQPYPSLDL